MADKGSPSLMDEPTPSSTSQPALSPARTDNSRSHHVFTPRSSTFPDDSDSEFDIVENTPIHSPTGPDYDDLPPSYEQAQAQALEQARTGYPIPNANNLQVHRLVLDPAPDPDFSIPSLAQAQPGQSQPIRNADGLGSTVPVTVVPGSTAIPVHQIPSSPPDPPAVLLSRVLEFTQHAPDADLQYAPRLTRIIAIPQEGLPPSDTIGSAVSNSCHGNRGRHEGRRGGRGGRGGRHDPRQYHSTPDLPFESPPAGDGRSPTRFLRAYAKALHAHSIRPAEFASFIDGLNVLCTATRATPESLHSNTTGDATTTSTSLIQSYIAASNDTFFMPRGLFVRLLSLSALISALQIPTDHGQQAAAFASALDPSTGGAQHANALHPWIERLELDLPEPAGSMLALQAMGERIRAQTEAASRTSTDDVRASASSPSGLHHAGTAPEFPPRGHGPGGFPPWAGARGRHGRGPGVWGPGHRGPPWGGVGPPWGGRGGMGAFGRGGRGGPGYGAARASSGPHGGQSGGEWGGDLGRQWEEWGQNFGKMAEAWGESVGKRAEKWGEEVERTFSGSSSRPGGYARTTGHSQFGPPLVDPGFPRPTGNGQETGVIGPEAHPIKAEDDDDNSTDSDSDSDSSFSSDDDDEDNDLEDPESLFTDRVREINGKATSAAEKGKKSSEEIARERDAAIAKAQAQKTALEVKIEGKREKRTLKRELKARKREIKRELKRKKRELKAAGRPNNEDKRKMKEEWDTKKREHRQLKQAKKQEWRDKRRERRNGRKGRSSTEEGRIAEKMVWVVIENLGD